MASLFSTLLSYVDKPWKVFALIFLAMIGVITYTFYENRTEIASAIIHHFEDSRLLPDMFTKIAPALMAQTKADMTQLMEVDLEKNLVQSVSGYTKDGHTWVPDTNPKPAVTERSNPKLLLAIIQSVPKCLPVTDDILLLRNEYNSGLRYLCLVGVPPVVGIVSGLLYVGWTQTPNSADEEEAKFALLTAASKVASW